MNRRLAMMLALVMCATFLFSAVGTASAATLSIQGTTNRYKYDQGKIVTVRGTAQNGTTRITTSQITSAKVTIKNPSGTTVVNAATMTKDSVTGLVFYSYTLASNAPKGKWTYTVNIVQGSNSGTSSGGSFKVQAPVPSHATYFTTYTGTATCITSSCHATQASAMFSSVHYQWKGDTRYAIELSGNSTASKLEGINDFCINPDNNWLTVFNKLDGTKGPGGCAVCHAGLGLKPSTTSSTAQLNNIDCLICHSNSYKRVVATDTAGNFVLVPDPTINIQTAAKDLVRPTRTICMRCHQGAGGGDNYKRGDLESTLKACTKSYDVHMGTDGQNFTCQDCHRTDNHRTAGRGSDMRTIDSLVSMDCETCHSQLPHRSTNVKYADLNRHNDKVACSVCHVPTFAKSIPTDMHRNWTTMEIDLAKQLYDPEMTKATNQMPKYAWFDGYSHFYKYKTPVSLVNGVQKMSWPNGAFEDPAGRVSKITGFKVHTGLQPMEATSKVLLPVKNKTAFETGDVALAVSQGAAAAGIPYTSHTFQATERWMGIYHGVGPKATALSCSTGTVCHKQISATAPARMDFPALGYARRGTTTQLCDVCHSAKSWSGFESVHSRHRDVKNCVTCHGTGYPLKEPRTTLCDNCHSMKSFSSADSVHSKHVQGKSYDCANCHTFSGGMTGGHGEEH